MELPTPSTPIPAEVARFLAEANRHAIVATIDPDGRPRQSVTWYALDPDGSIWLNSRLGRRWPANLKRDPRVSLAILDLDDPDRWVGLTGELVEVVDDVERAREDIVVMAHRYRPEGPDPADIARYRTEQRVMFRLAIRSVHVHLD
jgi:PPOX class probable F420-dependent enzyme